jgi:hypothetical protein
VNLVEVANTWSARRRMPAVVRERLMLGGSVRDIVGAVSPRRLPGASPLNRLALRPYCAELVALADRLDDLERPVSISGLHAVRRMLTDPDGVLYARPFVGDIGRELAAVARCLEVHR